MNAPNALLVAAYQNEDVHAEKLAGVPPLARRIGTAILNYEMAKGLQRSMRNATEESKMRHQLIGELVHQNMLQAEENLQYTPVPYSSMIRLASIAADAGRDMAKEAGIGGDLVGGALKAVMGTAGKIEKAMPWKAKIPLALAGLGAGVAAVKGGKAALNYMNQESGPKAYGAGGPQLNYGVNQYGQPQVGSSFSG